MTKSTRTLIGYIAGGAQIAAGLALVSFSGLGFTLVAMGAATAVLSRA